MKNVIVYGLGERFQLFQKWEDEWRTEYNFIGVCDKQAPDDDLKYEFIERDRLKNVSFELIIVTSDKYYGEIKDELIYYDVQSDNIVSLQSLIDDMHTNALQLNLFKGRNGVEIGGPTYIFKNTIYNICNRCDNVIFSASTVWGDATQNKWNEYSGRNLGNVIVADVTDMKQIKNEKYDFCISSNNLEHVANPLKAVEECLRVIKSKGLLLLLVPYKEKCFDHAREYDTFEHILDDYNKGIKEDDISHLDEILKKHDFSMDEGCKSVDEFMKRANNNYENRCLHHHVFDEGLLIKIYEFFYIKVIKSGILGTNIYIIGEKK